MRLSILFTLLFVMTAVARAQDLDYKLIGAAELKAIATESDVDTAYPTLWKLVAAEADRRQLDPDVRHYLEASFRDWEPNFRDFSRRLKTGNVNPEDDAQDDPTRKKKSRRDQQELSVEELKKLEHQEMVREYARKMLEDLANKPYYKWMARDGELLHMDVRGEVLQVVDSQNLLVILRHSVAPERLVWISGVDTSRMIDDMHLPPGYFSETIWRHQGVRQYTTPSGATNTVTEYAHYPLPMSAVRKQSDLFWFGRQLHFLQKHCQSQYEEEQARLVHEQNTREWRDASGKFAIVATFRSVIGDNVKLIKEDGSEILVLLEKLCDADRAWISNRK